VTPPGSAIAGDSHTGKETMVDLEVRHRPTKAIGVAIGAFDIYPDALLAANSSSGSPSDS
jgi:hypothetical protein